MDATIQTGRSTMRLQLNPRELGAIDVHLVSGAQGVSVTVFAEHASTGRLLELQIDQLRQSLKEAGVQLSDLNISQQGQPGQQGGSSNRNPHSSQPYHRMTQLPEADTAARLRSERAAGYPNGIDYRV